MKGDGEDAPGGSPLPSSRGECSPLCCSPVRAVQGLPDTLLPRRGRKTAWMGGHNQTLPPPNEKDT